MADSSWPLICGSAMAVWLAVKAAPDTNVALAVHFRNTSSHINEITL